MANNNSTFVPGMERSSDIPNPYAAFPESGYSAKNNGETFVPGMQAVSSAPVQSISKASQAPVVGFLYSISHAGITEYWPIHLGANIIGRGDGVDINLNEATVSSRHAQINVKQMRVSHKLIANIQDIGSKRGMFLNDEELDYETHPCKNGDVITIGDAYKLLIVLIDTESVGLAIAENFVEVAEKSTQEETRMNDFTSTSPRINPYDRNTAGTVDLSGAAPIGMPGGTVILD